MTRVIVKPELLDALQNHTGAVEVCSDTARIVGRFFPHLDLSQYEPLQPQVSDEELMRRAQSEERTYTTVEVLAYLEKL